MDLERFRKAIETWITYTLPGVGFMWAGQNQTQLKFPYVVGTIRRTNDTNSADSRRTEYNDQAPNGEEVTTIFEGIREISVQIDVYSIAKLAPKDAVSLGERLMSSLRGDTTKRLFKEADFAFWRRNQGQTIPSLQNETHIQRYMCDMFFHILSVYEEKCGYIETVIVNGNTTEPVVEMNQTITLDTD